MDTKIVTLCGSTKFKDDFLVWNKKFTLEGYIVLMPGVFGHSGDNPTEEQKINLDKLHKEKILMSNFIFVINQNQYIGNSTKNEINFAKERNIPVYYLEKKE